MKYKRGLIAGTWDLFHIGHLTALKKVKRMCKHLTVGINTDKLVTEYKCYNPPIISWKDRAEVVSACKYVDKIVKEEKIMDTKHLINKEIDVIFIGTDWINRYVYGVEWAKRNSIKVIYIPYMKRVSSTKIKEKIKNEWFKP